MIKILIGGSPCTHWSIAQSSKNRETEASGEGWELFKNYVLARERFAPDFFLYENNKSAAPAIKEQIGRELNAPLQYINSALVSAQNRERFYVHNFGDVPQPEDRGIVLQDILETGIPWQEKAYCLTATYEGAIPKNTLERKQRTMIAEPVCMCEAIAHKDKAYTLRASGGLKQGQSNLIRHIESKGQFGYMGVPVRVGCLPNGRGEVKNSQGKRVYSIEGKSVPLQACASAGGTSDQSGNRTGLYAVPVRIGTIENNAVNQAEHDSKPYRVYSPFGKGVTLQGEAGGAGAKTGLYACPVYKRMYGKKPVYEVMSGIITIKGEKYPIKLPDGYYIIRKLSVTECCRLQTLPDDYCRAVSASQGYKGLGNGWTAEVIIHLLSHALRDVPRDEKIVVLSMYDGIGTGRYCFDKLGFKNITYYAYEFDDNAVRVAMSNYPDIKQCGDAFSVRKAGWFLADKKGGNGGAGSG